MLEQANYEEAEATYQRMQKLINDYHDERLEEMRKLAEESAEWLKAHNIPTNRDKEIN